MACFLCQSLTCISFLISGVSQGIGLLFNLLRWIGACLSNASLLFSRSRFDSKSGVKKKGPSSLQFESTFYSNILTLFLE